MVLPVPKRRAFRNVFKVTTGRVYKAPPKPPPAPVPRGQFAPTVRRPPGTNALREIKHYQSEAMSDKLIIPKAAFTRLVREVLSEVLQAKRGGRGAFAGQEQSMRIEADALVALQTMTEHIIVMVMEMCQKLAIHAKRTTVMQNDMQCLLDLWKTIDPTCPIGRDSALTTATREREQHAGRRRLAKLVGRARDKAAAARAQGLSVDKRTAHFLNKR